MLTYSSSQGQTSVELAQVPISLFRSGGLESSIAVVPAAEFLPLWLLAFSGPFSAAVSAPLKYEQNHMSFKHQIMFIQTRGSEVVEQSNASNFNQMVKKIATISYPNLLCLRLFGSCNDVTN